MRHRHYRDGQEPLGLPSSAQLPSRHRGGDLLLQARVRRHSLHLARTGPLQGLHLVRRGGAQPGAVRPAQTGLAAPDGKAMKTGKSGRPQLLVCRFPPRLLLLMREMRPAPITLISFRSCYTAEKHAFMDAHYLASGKPLPAAHPAISNCCDCLADQAANSRFSRARSRVGLAPYDANTLQSQLRWMPKQFCVNSLTPRVSRERL